MKKLISLLIRFVPRPLLQRVSHIGLRVLAIFYRGNNVECPISGRTYRKFLPYGRINPRDNALCPDSLSLERHRLLWLYLKNKTNFFTDRIKFLHVAPELCFMDRFDTMSNLEYITGDLVSPLAKVKMDLHQIPFSSDTFDVVMANHVMEHVRDDITCMKEIYRVLKPGGWAIMQVPSDYSLEKTYENPAITKPADREKHFGQRDHVRQYGLDYNKRLEQAGFKVLVDDYVKQLPEEKVCRYALPKEELIYFCTKE
jgi:SAM-dependent methyltransferase